MVTGVEKTGEEKKERKKLLEVVTTLIAAVMVVYTMVTGVMEGRDFSWIKFPSLFLL